MVSVPSLKKDFQIVFIVFVCNSYAQVKDISPYCSSLLYCSWRHFLTVYRSWWSYTEGFSLFSDFIIKFTNRSSLTVPGQTCQTSWSNINLKRSLKYCSWHLVKVLDLHIKHCCSESILFFSESSFALIWCSPLLCLINGGSSQLCKFMGQIATFIYDSECRGF